MVALYYLLVSRSNLFSDYVISVCADQLEGSLYSTFFSRLLRSDIQSLQESRNLEHSSKRVQWHNQLCLKWTLIVCLYNSTLLLFFFWIFLYFFIVGRFLFVFFPIFRFNYQLMKFLLLFLSKTEIKTKIHTCTRTRTLISVWRTFHFHIGIIFRFWYFIYIYFDVIYGITD